MIAFLVGTVAAIETGEKGALILNVQGVGYRVRVPDRLLRAIPGIGAEVQVFTQLLVRDTEILLYGFGTAAEREVFGELIKVSGVGPALGIALLNQMELTDLVQAIVSNNIRVLTLTPGIGAKTAQRLALELKAKLAAWRQQAGLAATPVGGPSPTIREEVEMSLLALGYTPLEISQALQAIGSAVDSDSTEDWLRAAIVYLSSS